MLALDVGRLNSVACDLCGGNRTRPVVIRPDGLSVEECFECGLCYLNPRPASDLIQNLYDGDYFSKNGQSTEGSYRYGYNDYLGEANKRLLAKAADSRLRLASPYLNILGKSCLEIGCATGEFCELIADKARNVVGIDLSGEAIATATGRYPRINFRQGNLSALREHDQFDAIFGFEVIEHIESPAAFLRELADHLKPGGRLVITTPNYNCGKRVGAQRWSGFQSSLEHLYFFNSESLSRYAKNVGLVPIVSLTGCGDGIHTASKTDYKTPLRSALRRLGVLNLIRRFRPVGLSTDTDSYSDQDDLHNLFMVLAKV
jgi:2-polyprenyl-3-methyl-5-hydroxy-6-metoxy-1,4-benzoquinol methylase